MDSVAGKSSIDLAYEKFEQEMAAIEASENLSKRAVPAVCNAYLSPSRTIVPVIHATPQSIKEAQEVIAVSGLEIKLTPNREGRLKRGLVDLITIPDESRRKRWTQIIRNSAFGGAAEVGSPESVTRAQSLLEGPGASSASLIITQTNKGSEKRFLAIDFTHIVEGEVASGFHFCPPTDPRRILIERYVVNPDSGVGAGWYDKKFSTFFPDSIVDKEQLTTALTIPEWDAFTKGAKNLKALCQISDGTKTFYAIQHLQNYGASIRTCYPLFYAKDIEEIEEDISVPGVFSVKKDEVITFLERKVRNRTIKEQIVFALKTGQLLIRLDGMRDLLLPKGIYLFIRPEVIGYLCTGKKI